MTRPASRVSLLEVVRAIDGTGLWARCILGLEECSDAMPCPAHTAWKQARSLLEDHLGSQSLVDLTRAVERRQHERKSVGTRLRKPPDISDLTHAAGSLDAMGDR